MVASATQAAGTDAEFLYADHLFPIRGRHNLGYSDTNNFGGGRNHQGQDMFARCGTRIAAARGGRVEYAGYQAAAGYYTVIDGAETSIDYVYMHMLEPALVKTGQRVFTGQKIGEVGETGRASGCHLHFELWSAPGWYKGGQAFDHNFALLLVGESLLGAALDFESLRAGFNRHRHQLDSAALTLGQFGEAPIHGVGRGVVLAHIIGAHKSHPFGKLGNDLHIVRSGRARVLDADFIGCRPLQVTALRSVDIYRKCGRNNLELDLLLDLQIAVGPRG